jgi:hypothetical protein
MKKIVFLSIYFSLSSITALWAQDNSNDLLEVEMRHHHKSHCRRHRHHSSSERGPTGPTGPTGARGATGNTGSTGPTGPLSTSPSFGSFYSTIEQTVPLGGAVFFETAGAGPIGTAFSFDPGTDITGSSFLIDETGFYAISYGLFAGVTGGLPGNQPPSVGLNFNLTGITGSYYIAADVNGDIAMPAFMGIFHLGSTGVLQLVNIGQLPLLITPPDSVSGPSGSPPVDVSAYISIQFLEAD